ncbi:hypothetical protein C8R44DRAFT_984256 [Mycena epipterygia]|nr:hypothetical protein C8R44DRAFT_984256 [Mycena epipterygia]
MTAASTVLHIQELYDQVATFLQQSSTDLKSCALVCPTLTSSAQYHLFHDIILHRGCPAIDDVSPLFSFDEQGACTRLCSVLDASSHLAPLIRRLRISLDEDTVKQLCKVKFPNLQDIIFHNHGCYISAASIPFAGELNSLPSIRRVGLLSLLFCDMDELRRLFEHFPPRFESLFMHNVIMVVYPGEPVLSRCPKIKQLSVSGSISLVEQSCPFDFSQLCDVDSSRVWDLNSVMPAVARLLDRSRMTITRLKLHTWHVAPYGDAEVSRLTSPHLFPALTHLAIVTMGHALNIVEALIVPLPPSSRIQVLTLEICQAQLRYLTPLGSLVSTLASMSLPALHRIEVLVYGLPAGDPDAQLHMQSALAPLADRYELDVVVF